MDEREAIAHIKQGNLVGLKTLVALYQQEAVRIASLIVQDRMLAEDTVSDCFLKVYERIEQFDQSRPFWPWFRKMVINASLQTIRRRKRLLSFNRLLGNEAAVAETLDDFVNSLQSPAARLEQAERKRVVRQSLLALSPTQRAVLILRYYADLNEAEIADALDIPRGTVKSRTAAAKIRLRGLLLRTPSLNRDEFQADERT